MNPHLRNGKSLDQNRATFKTEMERRVPSTLLLHDFLDLAIEYTNEAVNKLGLEDEWKLNSPTFPFCRLLKGHSEFRPLSARQAALKIDEYLLSIHGQVALDDLWARLFPTSNSGDARAEFCRSWDTVRHPLPCDPVTDAICAAQEFPLKFWARHGEKQCLFLSSVLHLQRRNPSQPIFIPEVKWAEHFDVHYRTIGTWRQQACDDGILRLKERGHKGRADRFEAYVEAFDWSTGEQMLSWTSAGQDEKTYHEDLRDSRGYRRTLEGLREGQKKECRRENGNSVEMNR